MSFTMPDGMPELYAEIEKKHGHNKFFVSIASDGDSVAMAVTVKNERGKFVQDTISPAFGSKELARDGMLGYIKATTIAAAASEKPVLG